MHSKNTLPSPGLHRREGRPGARRGASAPGLLGRTWGRGSARPRPWPSAHLALPSPEPEPKISHPHRWQVTLRRQPGREEARQALLGLWMCVQTMRAQVPRAWSRRAHRFLMVCPHLRGVGTGGATPGTRSVGSPVPGRVRGERGVRVSRLPWAETSPRAPWLTLGPLQGWCCCATAFCGGICSAVRRGVEPREGSPPQGLEIARCPQRGAECRTPGGGVGAAAAWTCSAGTPRDVQAPGWTLGLP